jgi:hypothetical protein
VLERLREARRVGEHLALVHEAALVLVDELDRVLDRDDVLVRSRLTLSIMAASVVLLPLPVGPVTSTRPRGRWSAPAPTAAARAAAAADGVRDHAEGAAEAPFWLKRLPRNGSPLDPEREVELEVLLELLLLASVRRL